VIATMGVEARMPYSCGNLDRAGALRRDPAWITATLRDPAVRVIPMWQGRCLVADGVAVSMPGPIPDSADPVFLGLDHDAGVFALDLSHLDLDGALAASGASDAVEVRQLVATLDPAGASVLAYARGILHWHRNQRFCGACGSLSEVRDGGHLRACTGCSRLLFPRIEPAVIMLIEAPAGSGPARCLLGRHRGSTLFSTLAGFVEIGESLEGAVRREAFEEAGVRVGDITYQASQAWPFPSGIMIGFRGRALSDEIAVDRDELEEARWFTRAEVRAQVADARKRGRQPDSIESTLVEAWLSAGA
jgi:NAD+ diphosphatase